MCNYYDKNLDVIKEGMSLQHVDGDIEVVEKVDDRLIMDNIFLYEYADVDYKEGNGFKLSDWTIIK